MKSLNIDNIALNILPKSYDSHVGINYTSCTSNFNYSYFYNRGISFFNFDSKHNPSIKYVHNVQEKSLEIKFDMNTHIDNIQTSVVYHPFMLHNFILVQRFINLIKTKHFSMPIAKLEIDSINGMNFFFKNKIRPFADSKNSKFLKINVENSYSSNILCSNIQFAFPSFRFSIFSNTKQSIFSMKFGPYFNILSNFSFVFDHNKFITFLPEAYITDPLKLFSSLSKKYQSILKINHEKDVLGVKFDSENKYFLLRHENHFKTEKGSMIDCGLSISYRQNSLKTGTGLRYTTEDKKWSLSLGKSENTKLNASISRLLNNDTQITGGFSIGPILTKYPSKSFCFEINFYNNDEID